MKHFHFFSVIALLGVGCGGAIAQDLGSSDSGSGEDAGVVHSDGGSSDRDGGGKLDGSHLKDASTIDANPFFACGAALACNRSSQVCKIGEGGPAGATPQYSCQPIPAACYGDVSCDCMKRELSSDACSITDGAITIKFFYP